MLGVCFTTEDTEVTEFELQRHIVLCGDMSPE